MCFVTTNIFECGINFSTWFVSVIFVNYFLNLQSIMPSKTCLKCNTAVESCLLFVGMYLYCDDARVSVKTRKLEKQEKRALEAFDDVLKRRE